MESNPKRERNPERIPAMKKIILFAVFFTLISDHLMLFAEEKIAEYKAPPIEAYSSLPVISRMKLSPDGKYIAGLLNYKGDILLRTQKLYSQESHIVLKFDNKEYKVRWYDWANNRRLLVGVLFPSKRDYYLKMGESRLLAINCDGSKGKELAIPQYFSHPGKGEIGRPSGEWESQFRDKVIDFLPGDRDHVLISVDFEEPTYPSVYKMNIYNGKRKLIKRFQPPIRQWITDQQGRIRVGYGYKESDFKVIACDSDGKNWRTIWEFEAFTDAEIIPLGFGIDPNMLYVQALYSGKAAVFKVDLRQEPPVKNLVAWDPKYDISGSLILSPKSRDVIGVYYVEDTDRYLYWDNTYKAFQLTIDKALPQTINYIINWSKDEKQYVLFSTGSFNPGTFYYGDVEKRSLDKIGECYPDLSAEDLSGKKMITYKARDGLEITGYLTLPKYGKQKPYPAIIYPHGGPSSRDDMDFDYWTEFFASRGYAVLQMNFRGSEGFGSKFMTAGFKNWGLTMQDDITDGTLWLIQQGIADPYKIGIVGASYGGYAALMGAVKTPDLYNCAVSFAGVSDLKLLLEHERHFVNSAINEEIIGNRFKDSEQLVETSPLRNVDKIKIPIFIAHGDKDLTVDVEHSDRMADALKNNNKEYEYLLLEGGDHHLSQQTHRILFFTRLDAFLAKYLK